MEAIVALCAVLVYLYTLLIFARVLMSWIQVDPYHPVVRVIFNLTEPLLAPVRNMLPPAGGLDFSPIIVIILLQVLEKILEGLV